MFAVAPGTRALMKRRSVEDAGRTLRAPMASVMDALAGTWTAVAMLNTPAFAAHPM